MAPATATEIPDPRVNRARELRVTAQKHKAEIERLENIVALAESRQIL